MTLNQLGILVNRVCGDCANDYLVTNILLVDGGSPGEFVQLDVMSHTTGLRRRVKLVLDQPLGTKS